ncbi:hypothetical protein BIV59_04550 [Bacillus sp. MUM 13]|nr:hypothetical protein BIV59_04550 [Bacillus sp. MUM 13]
MKELENRPCYEKTWDTVAAFGGEITGFMIINGTEGTILLLVKDISRNRRSEKMRNLIKSFKRVEIYNVIDYTNIVVR